MEAISKNESRTLSQMTAVYLEVLETSSMILQELEKMFISKGCSLKQRAKQRNNRILFHLTALKQLTGDDMFTTEHQVFASNWENWDDMRRDSAYIARIVLLLHDRTWGDGSLMGLTEDFLWHQKEQGIIPEDLIKRFTIR